MSNDTCFEPSNMERSNKELYISTLSAANTNTNMKKWQVILLLVAATCFLIAGIIIFDRISIYFFISTIIMTGLTRMITFFAIIFHFIRTKGYFFTTDNTLPTGELPVFTILSPLYKDANCVVPLIYSLSKIDYPPEKLDIKFLLEESDIETIEAFNMTSYPDWMSVVVVPEGTPRTKPRALNFGLKTARGDIVGIYDAEDHMDPKQLLKITKKFKEMPNVSCLQSRLSWYNSEENWITRCFTIEYALWFEIVLRVIVMLGMPVPLGGTSMFIKTNVLKDIGGFDAYNVTEDADLGMRLARCNYHVELVDSITLEEAPSSSKIWIRQRSRWLKGYLVTWLVHMQHFPKLVTELGILKFIGSIAILLGGISIFIVKPFIVLILLLRFGFGIPIIGAFISPTKINIIVAIVIAGQIINVILATIALKRIKKLNFFPWLIATFLYWAMATVAAILAVYELLYCPQLWHKTPHGETSHAVAARHVVL